MKFKKIKSLNNKNILITGGTGSFGYKFADLTLKYQSPKKLVIFSNARLSQSYPEKKQSFLFLFDDFFIISLIKSLKLVKITKFAELNIP